MLLCAHTAYGQDGISYLNKFSSELDLQFAYDPDQFDLLQVPNNWSKIANKNDLRKALKEANIEIAEIESDRWLLRREIIDQVKTTYIKGRVSDNGDEGLVSALIYTKDGKHSALTNDEGAFILEIPSEIDCEICCQYLGYDVQCLPNSQILSFDLQPKRMLLDDVQITSKKIQVQMMSLDDKEVISIRNSAISTATLGKDVMRSVQLLSGVDATNDLNAAMVVRGSSSLQSLVTLDGIPLYNTESAFGMFSVMNPLVVTNTSLYKNTMPLEYGEFTGGYLACEGLGSIQKKLSLNIDINTLQSSAAIQIPIGKSTQISGAFRRSNGRISNKQYYSNLQSNRSERAQSQSFFSRPESLQTSMENAFGDLYFNLLHEWKKGQSFSMSFVGNRDISGANYEGENSFERNNRDINVNENYLQDKRKSNAGISVNYKKRFEQGSELQLQYYTSLYGLKDSIASGVTFRETNREDLNLYDSTIGNNVRDSNLKFQFRTPMENKWSFKTGLDMRIINTDFGFVANDLTPYEQERQVPILTPYGGVQYKFEDKFIARFGLRSAIVPIENPVVFHSPRLSLRLKLNDKLSLKTSGSLNQQFFRPVELERQLGPSTSANLVATGRNLPVLKSAQLTLGMQYGSGNLKINGDAYIRKNDGIVEQVLNMPGLRINEDEVFGNNDYNLFQGSNEVLGFDVSSSFEYGRVFTMLTYTYSYSVDRFPDLFDNKAIVDQNNRLHQLNLFLAYNHKAWTFSSTFVFGTGVYALDRAAIGRDIDRINVDPNLLFTQLPSYHRWDLSTSYKLKTKIGNLHFDFGVLNLLDTQNVNSELYLYSVNNNDQTNLGATQIELLGRVWNAGIRYSF